MEWNGMLLQLLLRGPYALDNRVPSGDTDSLGCDSHRREGSVQLRSVCDVNIQGKALAQCHRNIRDIQSSFTRDDIA